MYTIGEISKIVNISTDTLRYYDEIGLLKPVRIDTTSKYRYYSNAQVEDILLIMELKQYGFSLEEIKHLLTCKNSNDIKEAFQARLAELGVELSNIKHIMETLQKRINELERESDIMSDKKSVLIVDDIYLVRLLIRNILEKFGYIVAGEAENGLEACEKYFELVPDLVIMDITMPVMDGIYASKKIREKYNDAKILMCSGMSQAVIVIESLKSGALDFICKPFTEMRLIDGVEKALSNEINYDLSYLSMLINQINNSNFGNLDKHKPLNQIEMDEFLELLYTKASIHPSIRTLQDFYV